MNLINGKRKLPVTVLDGFIVVVKTALLNHVLNSGQGLKVAVIVKGMSESNIDEKLMAIGARLSYADENREEISNGCICCTLRENLMIELGKLATMDACDCLLMESSGVSECLPIVQTFSFNPGDELYDLTQASQLDTMVTKVEAFNFFKDFGVADIIRELEMTDDQVDDQSIAHLLTGHVGFVNVIAHSKSNLIPGGQLALLENTLRKLNPAPKMIDTTHSTSDPQEIRNTGPFDSEVADQSAGWQKGLELTQKEIAPSPETDQIGIHSFVYQNAGLI